MLHSRPSIFAALLIASISAATARGQLDEEGPTSQPTVDAILKEITAKYGAAAVALQGYLLQHAIDAGSQLEATASIVGREMRDGHEYLVFDLDTGIVYAQRDVSRPEQLSRIWTDVVEPSLRKAALIHLTGEGVLLRIRSSRGDSADRVALAEEMKNGRLQPVAMSFALPLTSVRAFVDGAISINELATRSTVEVDGTVTRLEVIPTPVPTEEPTAIP